MKFAKSFQNKSVSEEQKALINFRAIFSLLAFQTFAAPWLIHDLPLTVISFKTAGH